MTRATQPAMLARPLSLLAALLVVLGLLAGCGSSESSSTAGDGGNDDKAVAGPPTDASVEEFCGAFLNMIQQATQAGGDISDAEAIKLAKQTVDQLAHIGTPEDIPDDAREAFELAIEKIQSIPDDATRQEMEEIAGELTKEQEGNLDALTTYVTQKCMALPSGDAPSN